MLQTVEMIVNGTRYASQLNAHQRYSDELKPEIRELVEQSRHRTFRVFFKKHVERDQQEEILNSMNDLTISYERANDVFFSLDMQPEGNYDAIFDRLDELEQEDLLEFETCERKLEGSFDDLPEEEESETET